MFALLVKLIVRKLIPTAGILGEAETVPHETSSFTGLNDVLRKTLLWEAKSNCRSVYSFCELQWRQNETNKRHIESGVETNIGFIYRNRNKGILGHTLCDVRDKIFGRLVVRSVSELSNTVAYICKHNKHFSKHNTVLSNRNKVLSKHNIVLSKENTILWKHNTMSSKHNTVSSKHNTVLWKHNIV